MPPSPFLPNHALYARCAIPRSAAETEAALAAFDADVRVARERHGVANCLIIASALLLPSEEEAAPEGQQAITIGACGSLPTLVLLSAQAYRWGREQQMEILDRAAGMGGEGEER